MHMNVPLTSARYDAPLIVSPGHAPPNDSSMNMNMSRLSRVFTMRVTMLMHGLCKALERVPNLSGSTLGVHPCQPDQNHYPKWHSEDGKADQPNCNR